MILTLLFFTGLIAGLVDAIAGGGGLITIPVLLSTGMSPSMILGTNKLQSSVGTLMAASHFYRRGCFSVRDIVPGLLLCAAGALLGASATLFIQPHFFKLIVPYLLLGILGYMVIAPYFKVNIAMRQRVSLHGCYVVAGFILGFYDGFFGPGTGSFWMFVFMFLLGFDIVRATTHTKVFNLISNLMALCFFASMQRIDYEIGVCMAIGQLIGGYIGARLALYKGAQLIRPLFLTTVFVTIAMMFRAH